MLALNRVDLAVTVLSLLLLYFIKRQKPLRNLRGPPVPSYLLGLEHDLRTKGFYDGLLRWSKEYGTAYRLQGCFGENILVISDPRAIHRVLQESLQDYPEAADVRRLLEMIFGRGVIWVQGEDHKRHRRVLSPAFSINHMRQFLPVFHGHVNHLSEKWNNILQGKTQTIDIIPWFHKLTLDVVGESAFNYHFDALDNKPNELTKALYDIEKLTLDPTPTMTLVMAILRRIPDTLAWWQTRYFPLNADRVVQRYLQVSNEKAGEVLRNIVAVYESNTSVTGTDRDILSMLVHANRAEDPKKRLREEEILPQMSTIIQAGHHTTGYTLSWILYELAGHPEDQARVYEEIRRVRERHSGEFTSSDYDSMGYLTLVLKETLRLHPIVPSLERQASKNDILFLDFPVVSRDGTTAWMVPVRKGQRIRVDISSYNRLEGVWGEDADLWNPKRFETMLGDKVQTQVGLFANVLTFSGGPKGCVGWRFALMEMQATVAGLLERYEFSVIPDLEVEPGSVGPPTAPLVVPSVKGKHTVGPELPLKVTPRAAA